MSRILRLEPASQPQNLQAEPEKLERVTYRSNCKSGRTIAEHNFIVHSIQFNSIY